MSVTNASSPVGRRRTAALAVSLALACASLASAYPWLWWPATRLVSHGLMVDDALFYAVLARNLPGSGFLTLDGVIPTNGVQPLWMLIQGTLACSGLTGDPVRTLAWTAALSYAAFAFLFGWTVGRQAGRPLVALCFASGLVLNAGFRRMTLTGLEVPLALALVLLTALAVDRAGKRAAAQRAGAGDGLVLGALCAAVFLARTDLFAVPIVVAAWWCGVTGAPRRAKAALAVGAGMPTAAYLGFNLWTQSSVVPVSGVVKAFYVREAYHDLASYLASDSWHGLAAAVAAPVPGLVRVPVEARTFLALAVIGAALAIVLRMRTRITTGLRLLGIVVPLHLFALALWYRDLRPYCAYYFAPEIAWISAVFVIALAHRTPPPGDARPIPRRGLAQGAVTAGIAAGVLIGCGYYEWRLWPSPVPYQAARLDLAGDVRAQVPREEALGAFWPGVFAAFSDRPVVPLDGIVGSREQFDRYVRPGRELEALGPARPAWVALYLPRGPRELDGAAAPPVRHWTERGLLRVWEARREGLQVRAARPVDSSGAGWYLLRLGARPPER